MVNQATLYLALLVLVGLIIFVARVIDSGALHRENMARRTVNSSDLAALERARRRKRELDRKARG